MLNSFKVRIGSKTFDYRLGENLDHKNIKDFFEKNYQVKKLWSGSRHVLGVLTKDSKTYFLKLSTSKGISIVTKTEYNWNDYFNEYFPKNSAYTVPRNYASGIYEKKYFYLITDYFEGELLCDANGDADCLIQYIPQIILLAELIQKLPKNEFRSGQKIKFINKTRNWFNDIPVDVRKKFDVFELLNIVEEGINNLSPKFRHGDFTPWHMIKLDDGKLGLIDGEHALPDGVENYDICYFIQRVFSVLKNPRVAQSIYSKLLDRGYKVNKLKTVLAARAIGGFLDESLKEKPDYQFAKRFKDWIVEI